MVMVMVMDGLWWWWWWWWELVDEINDSDLGRPGKVETVMGVLQQEETEGGSWEVVHSQRKTREMKAAAGGKGGRMGSIERMFLALLLTRTVAQVEEIIRKR